MNSVLDIVAYLYNDIVQLAIVFRARDQREKSRGRFCRGIFSNSIILYVCDETNNTFYHVHTIDSNFRITSHNPLFPLICSPTSQRYCAESTTPSCRVPFAEAIHINATNIRQQQRQLTKPTRTLLQCQPTTLAQTPANHTAARTQRQRLWRHFCVQSGVYRYFSICVCAVVGFRSI